MSNKQKLDVLLKTLHILHFFLPLIILNALSQINTNKSKPQKLPWVLDSKSKTTIASYTRRSIPTIVLPRQWRWGIRCIVQLRVCRPQTAVILAIAACDRFSVIAYEFLHIQNKIHSICQIHSHFPEKLQYLKMLCIHVRHGYSLKHIYHEPPRTRNFGCVKTRNCYCQTMHSIQGK